MSNCSPGIVVLHGFGVPKCFQDRVGLKKEICKLSQFILTRNIYEVTSTSAHLQNLLFNCSSFGTGSTTHEGKISHKHFCCFCFTSPTFSTNQDGLASMFIYHCPDIGWLNQLFLQVMVLFHINWFHKFYICTCNRHLQPQKDVDLAHRK